MDNMLLSSFVI